MTELSKNEHFRSMAGHLLHKLRVIHVGLVLFSPGIKLPGINEKPNTGSTWACKSQEGFCC